MGKQLIPRLFIAESILKTTVKLGPTGLDAFMETGSTGEVRKYTTRFKGILLQDPVSGRLTLLQPGSSIVLARAYEEYCHWHNGPLHERDDPLRRKYCLLPATSELGYCRIHKDSLRALYTRCFGSAGLESLRSCSLLDEKLGDRVEYVVYILAYAPGKYKVGTTRLWRIHERIGEQPHILAAILYASRSALETRKLEIKIGRLNGFTERPRRNLKSILSTPPETVAAGLRNMVERLRRTMNLKYAGEEYFVVEPSRNKNLYATAKITDPLSLAGEKIILEDYYAGYMLVRRKNSREWLLVKGNSLLHLNSLVEPSKE
jgi:hypothetical protein